MVKTKIVLYLLFSFLSLNSLGAESSNEWFVFMGHFHPLILHLPIGILLLAAAFEFLSMIPRFQHLSASVEFTLLLGMVSAQVAAILGYFLSLNGEYGGEILFWHQWLGISLAILTTLLYIIKRKKLKPMMLKLSMLLMLFLLTATGHYGGMLTHGEDYLTNNMPSEAKAWFGIKDITAKKQYNFTNVEEAFVFDDLIAPILEEKCVSCHNGNKIKGGLRLDSHEGIIKGGENGKILGVSNTDSEIVKLVHLPVEDERHMPPKGKKQLSENEIALLDWWTKQGSSFDVKVDDMPRDEDIDGILSLIETEANESLHPVYTKSIEAPDEDEILALLEKGIAVNRVAEASPFLEARLLQVPDGLTKVFKHVSDQLVWLNLSRSNCTSDDLSNIADLNNLTKLQLQQTDIDDEALAYISELEHLEYLNLYGTKVSDDGIENLKSLKNLKSLYLWETDVTASGIAKLQAAYPALDINGGVNLQNTDTVRLAKPLIISDKTMFNVSTEVSLELGFEGVDIYYTLDDSTPSESATKYEDPISIKETCRLKAVAIKQGWANSLVATAEFIRVKHIIEHVGLTNDPSPRYAADGANSLSDGQKGSSDFRSGQWLGFEEIDLIAELDLGSVKKPKEVIVSCLEEIGSYIFFPQSISVAISEDGKKFKEVNNLMLGIPIESRANSLKHFSLNLKNNAARYLRVTVKNVGRCPQWHPGAGDKAWVFVDEIVVN